MLTDPNDFHPVMGNWPRNREDLNTHAWSLYAPALLALMPPGDPGPVPAHIIADYRVHEDMDFTDYVEQDDDWLHPERFATEDPAAAIELKIRSMERDDWLNNERGRSGRGQVHAEPTQTVRRHLTIVK